MIYSTQNKSEVILPRLSSIASIYLFPNMKQSAYYRFDRWWGHRRPRCYILKPRHTTDRQYEYQKGVEGLM